MVDERNGERVSRVERVKSRVGKQEEWRNGEGMELENRSQQKTTKKPFSFLPQ